MGEVAGDEGIKSMSTELLRVDDVAVEEVDLRTLTDDDIRALTDHRNAMTAEVHPDDPPLSAEAVAQDVRNWPAFFRHRAFLGRRATGEIVASALGRWTTLEENKHLLHVELEVLPEHRRRGLGTAMLDRLLDVAEGAGRTMLMSTSIDLVDSGERFAAAAGASLGMAQGMNRLVLAGVDRRLVGRWVDEGPARAPGYSLVAVDGRYPDDLVEQVVDVHAVMNTAPRDDLAMEDERPSVEQARELEDTLDAIGLERWFLAARHDATGQLVGWTEVGWIPEIPTVVWQWGTGVRPEHRGHAIGKWLKAVMLQRILDERPQAVDVRTTNADSNDAMLGINHALGFTKYHTNLYWQAPVDRLRDYVGSRT